ncbi:MAG TPA: hypothetical protein VKS22_14630 [Candidatus Binataceae bacterium]|nr:hypothetical protein [Candidatus Binataceae bacterium]
MKLDELQRDILLPQIDAFLAAAPDAAARAQYATLRAAIAALEVPEALSERLGAIAEVLLSSGRVRDTHGPGANLALWALFQATPRGRGILASVAGVNAALKRLEGQTLEFVSAVARAPGVYSLTLKNAEMQLILRFEPSGVRIESAEVG